MRHGTDEQRVLFYGGIERNGFEQAGATARKDRQSVPGRLTVGLEERSDPLCVVVETLPLGRLLAIGAAAFGKHLPDELVVGVLAGLVRQQVEIEAEDGE